MERMMTQCQFANKFVLKYFSKLLNDFRIEQISFRDIILSEVDQTHIPLKLAAQASGSTNSRLSSHRPTFSR